MYYKKLAWIAKQITNALSDWLFMVPPGEIDKAHEIVVRYTDEYMGRAYIP